jgi:hypothetical protein
VKQSPKKSTIDEQTKMIMQKSIKTQLETEAEQLNLQLMLISRH